tara:strand:+ start:962 stop:1099 length:138 start_codon:yes stop_codon:yes gene_type:complete
MSEIAKRFFHLITMSVIGFAIGFAIGGLIMIAFAGIASALGWLLE